MKGKDYLLNVKKRELKLRSLPKKEDKKGGWPAKSSEPYWKKFCADSTYYLFGKEHNIYLAAKGVNADSAKQLTFDAEPYFSYTTYRSGETDTIKKSVRGDWLEGSRVAYFLRPDFRKVTTMTIVNSLAKVPEAKSYKFELTNDKNVIQYDMILVDADSSMVKKVDICKFKDQTVEFVKNFNRSVPYKKIFFTRRNRGCDTLELCSVDEKGGVQLLAQEVQKPIVNELLHKVAILYGGDEFIWWSERDGMGSYYLYNGDGTFKNRIAGDGSFVAGEIVSIDSSARRMIFKGYGYYKDANPYHAYYFAVNFDGSGFTQLTPSRGNHDISFSESKRYYIDTYSSVDRFPKREIRTTNGGRLIAELPQADSSKLLEYGWSRPIPLALKAADDSTMLYGVMYTPGDLKVEKIENRNENGIENRSGNRNGDKSCPDGTKKYPLIFNLYPGPQTDLVPRSFMIDDNDNGCLAQMGFIVVNIGLRGSSPYRGPEFYGFSHGRLRDYPLEDLKHITRTLIDKYDFIDSSRIGIYGHSGGGFLTAVAMLTYPEIFKVGVSVSGNHDNNIYGKFWGETYNGVGDKVATTMELAKNLKGKLLLIHGAVDNNVHPANTLRLVDAFMKANKRIDMFIIPGADHSMYGDYYNRLIRHYFIDNL